MSHYAVMVITNVHQDELQMDRDELMNKLEDEATRLLAPFNENIEVEAYTKPCWCCGRKACDEVQNRLNVFLEELKASCQARHPKISPWSSVRDDNLWREEVIVPYENRERELLAVRTDIADPNPGCTYCNGTGMEETTWNPQGYWDGWQVGGRFSSLCDELSVDKKGVLFQITSLDEAAERYVEAVRVVNWKLSDDEHFPENPFTYAVLTINGDWIGKGSMGWFGISRCESSPERWMTQMAAFYKRYRGHLGIICDLHI